MRSVELSVTARLDLQRLQEWLDERAPHVAERVVDILTTATRSLAEFPERGRLIRTGLRELVVPFGSAGYIIQYGVRPLRIIIARIFHSLEDR
ncbi:MAG: type II toxin-antitoxin system RelE/ParE family toxin [Caulobacter sp.]|nr:type II toxin-antitoxin system RelE/ParE family toxin [Caulobacter sp.]